MLAKTIRFQAQNSTGVAFGASDTLELRGTYWQLTTATGVWSATSELTPLAASSGNSLASGGFVNSAAIDTTTTGTTAFLQGDFLLTVAISTATPAGNVNIYMQESPDGGTTWPDNGEGVLCGRIYFSATGTKKTDVRAR